MPPSSSTLSLFTASSALALLVLCGCGGVKIAGTGSSAAVTAVSSGPQLGYAWGAQDQTLRPILGVPGSSQIGASVVPAGAFVAAAASSPSNLALLIGTDQQLYRMTLPSGSLAQVGLSAAVGSKIRFSPSGTVAILFVPGTTAATLVTTLATTPTFRPISAPSPILEAAASDAGTAVAALQSSGSATVDLLAASGAVQPLATLKALGGLSFAGSSENLVVADSAANTLTLIRAVSTAPSSMPIPTASLLKSPAAVATSLNGQWAAVANADESSVIRIDLTGASAPQRVLCPAQPAVVAQLSGNGVFRFNDLGTAPVWIADVTTPTPAMLFIPPLPQSTSTAIATTATIAETPTLVAR